MGKNTDKIFNDIYSSRSGRASRRAQHKWEEKNRKLKERHNKYKGTSGKESAKVINTSLTDETMAPVNYDPQVGGVARVRPEHMDSVTPDLNDKELTPAQQNKNNGMQPLRLIELSPDDSSAIHALQIGGEVQMSNFGRGSLDTDGNTNHSRLTTYQALGADGLPTAGQQINSAKDAFNSGGNGGQDGAKPNPSRPKQGKNYLSQGELTSDTQIPGAFIPATTRITSPFGYRIHPIKKVRKFHAGIDFQGGKRSQATWNGLSAKAVATKPEDQEPCFSALDGVVEQAFVEGRIPSDTGYGPVLYIKHQVKDKGGNERTLQTRYGHLEYLAVGKGDTVKKGQLVGHIGSQGASTGPHLHFEVREGGKPKDPVELFGWTFGPPAPPAPEGEEEDDFPQESLIDEEDDFPQESLND